METDTSTTEDFDLGSILDTADSTEKMLLSASGSFQIFAKLINGKTVTLNDVELTTTTEELHELIRAKDGGIPVSEKYLVYGGKNLASGQPIKKYGIGRESTVHVMGRLRGGYGERQAVKYTLDEGIQRGNNAQTIEDTGGKSRAHKDWGRHIGQQQGFYDEVFRILRRLQMSGKIAPLADDWWEKNSIHIRALIQETTGAGNCGDFAQIVHSQLVANTGPDQHVYQVVMAGKWDHQLCLTYPSSVSTIAAMDKKIATIADGWDNYMVVPLEKFLNRSNCYGAKIEHLDKCPDCGKSTGTGCATEEDKEKKCPGFLTIVAQQQCEGDGGLDTVIKDEIGGLISDLFENWKESDDYTEYLEKVKDDKRGIFRFRVGDDVKDKRSGTDIMEKLELLRSTKAPTLKAELLDLETPHLVAVFGDGQTWRDVCLSIPEVKAKLFESMSGMSTSDFLQCANHLDEAQFLEYIATGSAARDKVLGTDYAALRYFTFLNGASDGDVVTHIGSLTGAQIIAYYKSSKDSRRKLLGAAMVRNAFFDAIIKVDGSELTDVLKTLNKKLTAFFGCTPKAREKIFADGERKTLYFEHFTKVPPADFNAMAALMTGDQLLEFARAKGRRAINVVLGSTRKDVFFGSLQSQADDVILKVFKRSSKEEILGYIGDSETRRAQIESIPDLASKIA